MLIYRFIWPDGKNYRKRDWVDSFLPISNDYYKTTIRKSEKDGHFTSYWEEEAVESTQENIHSDFLLNLIALIIYIYVFV